MKKEHFSALWCKKKIFASLFLCEKNAHHLGEKYFQNGTWIDVWENKIFLELLTHFALIFVYTQNLKKNSLMFTHCYLYFFQTKNAI